MGSTTPPVSTRTAVASSWQHVDERTDALRPITSLMVFRLALASTLLVALVVVAFTRKDPEALAGPFAGFVFGLLGASYLATTAYGAVMHRVRNVTGFAYLQIGVDLVLITALVHGTGGAESAFTFLYFLDILAISLVPARHGPAIVGAASLTLFFTVAVAGYLRVLPVVPGQSLMPWDVSFQELLFRLVLNMTGMVTSTALGLSLLAQTREAGERVARQRQIAGDLASLHENTIRSLSSGLVTTGKDGSITSINAAACDILGITEAAALGVAMGRFVPGLGVLLHEAGPIGVVHRHEIDARRPDGEIRRLGVSATPLADHQGQVVGRVIHFQDLTALRRMELVVRRSERLASIGRLAAAVAHEIRNPLASISGSIEVLRNLPGTDAESRQLMDIAVRESDRLNHLITAMLEYARPPGDAHTSLDVGEAIADVTRAFEQENRPGLTIECDAPSGLVITGSPHQLRQILWNLMRNAAEAMPQGGNVRVRAVRRIDESGAKIVLTVTDRGEGIRPEDLDRIFEPFFSTKRGGTGLGLATVARIVEDHGGVIDVASELGQGTTFTLTFPATPSDDTVVA